MHVAVTGMLCNYIACCRVIVAKTSCKQRNLLDNTNFVLSIDSAVARVRDLGRDTPELYILLSTVLVLQSNTHVSSMATESRQSS